MNRKVLWVVTLFFWLVSSESFAGGIVKDGPARFYSESDEERTVAGGVIRDGRGSNGNREELSAEAEARHNNALEAECVVWGIDHN